VNYSGAIKIPLMASTGHHSIFPNGNGTEEKWLAQRSRINL